MTFNAFGNKTTPSPWNANKHGMGMYRPQHSNTIEYVRGASFQTVPSLENQLETLPIILLGLEYVWEYRSPSRTVQPHYECKLCRVARVQHDMIAHVKSAHHNFTYLKKFHPDKAPWALEELGKDPAVRKMIREAATEIGQRRPRGRIKVVIKEPYNVPACQGLVTTEPKPLPEPANDMGPNGRQFGVMFNDQSFDDEFPPDEGPYNECRDDYEPTDFNCFSPEPRFRDSNSEKFEASNFGPVSRKERFPNTDRGSRPYLRRPSDDFGPKDGRDRFNAGPMVRDEYQGPQIKMPRSLLERPVKKPFDRPSPTKSPQAAGCDPNELFHYLCFCFQETFQIENESDAQLVLKVTQKLTEQLMEYRLKTVAPEGSSSFSKSSKFSSSPSSSLPRSSDRFSLALPKGQPWFSEGSRRF
ncbi:uncharacterized protein si:ch211-197h24.6 isoform X1 [Syngnathus typhle]|uniref:uncharacterized protein si:ch211-197h24.6 isoform X1 n=1 Tax=Syngnathus typhle TaxID=161592 RepID=UPI002A6AB967|nr:uncharacterized protein si:ch211-197h24.6 isoform X1 [Syngnathus typhle]